MNEKNKTSGEDKSAHFQRCPIFIVHMTTTVELE